MASVTVRLYATLRPHVNGASSVEVEIQPGRTVEQILAELGVPAAQTRIIFVNHRAATLSCPLKGGDDVGVFPAIGGG